MQNKPQIKAEYLESEVGWPVSVLFPIDSQDLLLLTFFRAEIVPLLDRSKHPIHHECFMNFNFSPVGIK